MADYWKSQPRKFCQYCKCWIADNKPSIDFHERGKNHKENVAAKISEIKKKSIQKFKQEEKASKQFAAMEEAAVKAYEEDLKRMQREAAFGPDAETPCTTSTYQPVPTVQAPKQPQSNREESKQKKPQKKSGPPRAPAPPKPQTGAAPWVRPPTGAAPWVRPPTGAAPWVRPPTGAAPWLRPLTGAAPWLEGKTSEGYTYYYNTFTGESRWDKPEDIPGVESTSAKAGSTKTLTAGVWTEAVSPEGYTYYYNVLTGESSWEKPTDSTSSVTPGSSEKGKDQKEPSKPAESPLEEEKTEETSTEAEATEAGSKESSGSKIQFRKRKAEADPSDQTCDTPEETPKESEEKHKQEEEGGTAVTEGKEEEKEDETPTGRFRPPNPYGTWERIKVQKDPYANVDWQLPQVLAAEDIPPVEVPPEPKHKFKTRVITSLGDSAGSAPVTFKKKKTQNGKARSLRQRDDDD